MAVDAYEQWIASARERGSSPATETAEGSANKKEAKD
jgi:hypothetical protein